MVSSTYVIVPKKRKPDGTGLSKQEKNTEDYNNTLQTKNGCLFGHFSNIRTLEARPTYSRHREIARIHASNTSQLGILNDEKET